jgi:uncharacterized damage-inducible protein DinB
LELHPDRKRKEILMNTQVEQVQAILSTTPERWQRLVNALPGNLLTRPAAEGEWSAFNCLQHIVETERALFPARFRAFMTGQNFTPFDPNEKHADLETQTPQQLASEFARYRQENLALIQQVTDDDLVRTAQHPQFGTVTLGQMLHTWAAHDLNHTVQAERALMQPYMLGCGPWRSFFQDHEIGVAKE